MASLLESFGPLDLTYIILLNLTKNAKCRVHFNRHTIQFPDFSNTSYYNLEYRLTMMSDNFNPLCNSTSALLESWLWSDAKLTQCYYWWLLVMCSATLGQESFNVMKKTNKIRSVAMSLFWTATDALLGFPELFCGLHSTTSHVQMWTLVYPLGWAVHVNLFVYTLYVYWKMVLYQNLSALNFLAKFVLVA